MGYYPLDETLGSSCVKVRYSVLALSLLENTVQNGTRVVTRVAGVYESILRVSGILRSGH